MVEVPEPWGSAFAWIERTLGGRVVRAERQPRWRPAWLLDLERDGGIVPLYFRGERGETDPGVYSLEHEQRVLRVLEEEGIPVPHVHAFCPAPRGIVMERCRGRPNLATAASDAERRAVLDHYVELLARMHRIDVARFEAVGLARPATPEARALLDFDVWERAYRRRKRRPEPAIELGIAWVRRNVPRDRSRVSFVCADSGQFLFEDGRVTAVIDLELACLGDPAADLAGLRSRDLSEPLGDLARAVRRYEEHVGEGVDRAVVDHHTVRFGLVTPMAVAHLVAAPPPGIDVVQYAAWYQVWSRTALEVIGDRLGLDLGPPARDDPARGRPDAVAPGAPRAAADAARGFDDYAAGVAARAALWRERAERLAPALDAEYLDDAGQLLGRRFATRAEADAAVEEHVHGAGAREDAPLVTLLHRRACRDETILAPLLRELAGARVQRVR